jgi:hypothetical protein
VLVDVDSEFYEKTDEYLPSAKKILEQQKLDWPNVLATKGFDDTVQAFNFSGYGNIVVDAKGIVRGVNLHGEKLQKAVEAMFEASQKR